MSCFFDIPTILLLLFAYLMGSVPYSLIVTKLANKGDLRKQGSGNIGATNVARVAGKKLGLVAFMLDAIKGVVAVVAVGAMTHNNCGMSVVHVAAALAVVGHCFPVWLKFKGGKGVATMVAVLYAVHWPMGVVFTVVWLTIYTITHISSLSSLLATVAVPSAALYFASDLGYSVVYLAMFLCALVVAKHHSNIRRLLLGQERKI